jgi:hypothetical protein
MRLETRDDLHLFLSLEAGRHKLLAASIEQEASDDPEARVKLIMHHAKEQLYRTEIERLHAAPEEAVALFIDKYRHRWQSFALLAAA